MSEELSVPDDPRATEDLTPVTYVALYGIDYEADLDGQSLGLNDAIASHLSGNLGLEPNLSTFEGDVTELAMECERALDADECAQLAEYLAE